MRSTRLPFSLPSALPALLSAVVFAASLLAFGMLAASPAQAHDAAEGTSPSNAEVLAEAPDQVSVTFNRNPLGLGAEISVKDSAGADWAEGAVRITDNVASQDLRQGVPAGSYTVSWRVVSSDSHPIEGTFAFTVSGDGGTSTTAVAEGSPSAVGPSSGTVPTAGTVPTLGTAQPGATSTPEPAASSAEPFPWSIVGFAVVALGLIVALAVTSRRGLQAGERDLE